MVLSLRIIIGLFALLFLFMGGAYLVDPVGNASGLSLTPVGEHGLNTLRGDIAGLFLGSALMLVLGLLRRQPQWLLAVALLMAVIAAGRLVGFLVDGSPAQATLVAFGFEVVMAAVLGFAATRLPRAG